MKSISWFVPPKHRFTASCGVRIVPSNVPFGLCVGGRLPGNRRLFVARRDEQRAMHGGRRPRDKRRRRVGEANHTEDQIGVWIPAPEHDLQEQPSAERSEAEPISHFSIVSCRFAACVFLSGKHEVALGALCAPIHLWLARSPTHCASCF